MAIHTLIELKKALPKKHNPKMQWPYLHVGGLRIGLFDDTFLIQGGSDVLIYAHPKKVLETVEKLL